MNDIHFRATHGTQQLRWVRAFLLPCGATRWGVHHLLLLVFLPGAFCTFIVLCAEAGAYDAMSPNAHPKPDDPDRAAWIMFGTSWAFLLSFLALAFRAWLGAASEQRADTDVVSPPPMPRLASLVWILNTLAMPVVTGMLILYEQFIKNSTTYRESLDIGLPFAFAFMALAFLLGNLPLMAKHVVWVGLAVLVYFCVMFVYESATAKLVYPTIRTPLDVLVHVLFFCVVYLGLVAWQVAQGKCMGWCGYGLKLWDTVAV